MDGLRWQIVPENATEPMQKAMLHAVLADKSLNDAWRAALAEAPEPPHLSMTVEEARTFQQWAGMDGATAWHLIERHADGWGDVASMMNAWLRANSKPPNVGAKAPT